MEEKQLTYKQAIKLPKGGAVAMTKLNFQAQAAESISMRQGLRPEKLYDWANKHEIELSKVGYLLSKIEYNAELIRDVLNDTSDQVKKIIKAADNLRRSKK